MTAPPFLPSLSGLGWSVHKKPVFSTIVASHVSGREVRDALYQNPIWQFELTFNALDSASSYTGVGAQSLQSLMGFFLQCQGQYSTFLYTDPTDSAVTGSTGGQIGTGDGTTTIFTFSRFMGAFLEPVGWVTAVTGVWVGGSPLTYPTQYTWTAPNTLTLASAPASNAVVSAAFTFAFQCRFDADDMDFEQFMSNLWKTESVKFKSVRTS